VKDEYSISEELGYRYQGALFDASATFFNYNFFNKQVTTQVDLNGALINSSVNAGGQTSRGIDAEIGLKPYYHFAPYVSAEYLNATIDDNFPIDGDYLPTKGKSAVRSPKFSGAVGVAYDDGTYFGNLGIKYVSSQYSTFMNDEKIPDYATADITIGYRFPNFYYAKHPEIRLNLQNITDTHFLSGIANPTSNAQNATGIHGTAIAGASPTYYIGSGFAAIVTITTAF
jgi:iron complex outermembrane recepter protein